MRIPGQPAASAHPAIHKHRGAKREDRKYLGMNLLWVSAPEGAEWGILRDKALVEMFVETSVGVPVETSSSGCAGFVAEVAVIHVLFIRMRFEESEVGSAPNTCRFSASYLSPFRLRIPVGVRDLPADTVQPVLLQVRALVARTFGH